jgi:hypothetical protein
VDPVAEKLNAVHVSLADLLSTLADPVSCIDPGSGPSRIG